MITQEEVDVSAPEAVAHPPDEEFFELLLHCLLNAGDFALEHRRRLSHLMAGFRSDPRSAGPLAERVERELAPALPWSDLLDHVVHERWDRLLACRGTLARHLLWQAPLTRGRDIVSRGAARFLSRFRRSPASDGTADGGGQVRRKPKSNGSSGESGSQEPADSVTRKQIRGSGLLLAGRGLATGLKFLAELIVVRYLTTENYGSWTYALSAVTFLRGISALGLSRAISRYLPLHLERKEFQQFYGVMVFVFGSLVLAGGLVISAFYALPEQVGALAGMASDQPLALLFIMIFLVPVEIIDNALTGVSATFGDSRTIFVRRYLLHPGLRIAVAGTLVLMQADVILLAYGYLFSGVIGIAYYGWSVVTQMRARGLLRLELVRGLRLPVRKVLSYTAPVMASDWCSVFMLTAGPLLLGYFSDMSAVALYRVVVPVAALNVVVYQSFAMLFEPAASRLFARGDSMGVNRLYWRVAAWVAVLTFPLFAVSFTAADPLIMLLFGERYLAAAPILSLLAAGQFFDSMAGFNAAALRVTGNVRWLIVTNAFGAVTTVGLSILLIPSMGALGAGVGTAAGQLLYTILKQVALQMSTGVHAFDAGYKLPYLTIFGVGALLLVVRLMWPQNPWVLVPAATIGSVAVYLSARVSLSVTDTFPELARSRLLRILLG